MSTETHSASTSQPTHVPPGTSGSAAQSSGGGAVQLKRALSGQPLGVQMKMLAPRAEAPVQLKAVQREPLSTQTPATAGEVNATAATRGATVSQVNDNGTEKTVLTGGSMAKNPAFETEAKAFETRLGAAAASDGLTTATTLSGKCKQYLAAKHGEWSATSATLATDLAAIGADVSWTGAVGKEINNVMSVFDGGNLRMKMFHIGNFYSNVLQKDLLDAQMTDVKSWAKDTGINVAALKKRLDDQKATGAKPNLTQTPEGSETQGQGGARVRESLATGNPSTNMGATKGSLASGGVPLHPTEEKTQSEALGKGGASLNSEVLQYNTGAKVWAVNEQNKWVQMMRELSLPLEAGPSGTTNWLMSAAQDIGGVSMVEARRACMGHLLPYNHHSLVEIMAAAAGYAGCDFTPGQAMYRSIKPYDIETLRGFGGGRFPDDPPVTGT